MLQNGEDPSQEGTHLESGGGGWPSAEGSHTGATVALKLSVFWLNPLALTPEPGSALFSARSADLPIGPS